MTEFTSDEIKKMRNSAVFFGEPGCQVFREALDEIEHLQKDNEKKRIQLKVTQNSETGLVMENNELNRRIAELEAERRWIPVEKKRPENWEKVIVFDSQNGIFFSRFNGIKFLTMSELEIIEDVKFWQPFPQPPQEAE